MGHEDLATTALYLEVIPRKAARSIARLGKTLPRPGAQPPLAKGA